MPNWCCAGAPAARSCSRASPLADLDGDADAADGAAAEVTLLAATLMLAQGLGTRRTLDRMLAASAFTAITVAHPGWLPPVTEVLRRYADRGVHPSVTRTAAPGAAATARRRVRLLTSPTPSRSRGTAAAGQLEELCAGALGTGAPVVALACRLADLVPPRLVPLLDTTVALPPMGFGQFARLARIVLGGSNRLRPRSFESQRTCCRST